MKTGEISLARLKKLMNHLDITKQFDVDGNDKNNQN